MGFFSSFRKLFSSDAAGEHPQAPEQAGAAPTTAPAEGARAGQQTAPAEAPGASAAMPPEQAVPTTAAPGERGHTAPAQPTPSGGLVAASPEHAALTLALRQAEPRLSAWLAVVLEGVTRADDLLWQRLRFLLAALETPGEEAETFINSLKRWLADMGYEELEAFRSELQYRLALALDLEDEEDERSRLFIKLSEGLAKTREQISRGLDTLFAAGRRIDAAFWEELEEILIMADVGYETASKFTERLRKRAAREGVHDAPALRALMHEEIVSAFVPVRRISAVNPPEVILMVGVNGVGKTTTIAKLCHRAVLQGKKVMVVAADTFRAAATEQLEVWARRTGAGFYAKGHGADPAAVAFEAMDIALKEGYDTVFVDTAGRLHTKANLMEELAKIRRVLAKRHPGAPHRTMLVLDATTGQNGLTQAKLFHETCHVDDLVLTKLDGTAKGGIAIAIAMQYGIPISFIGLGEKMEDLRPFDPKDFVSALLQ